MKYLLVLNLLLISSICSGMEFLRTLKKKVEITFSSHRVTNESYAQPKVEDLKSGTVSERLKNAISSLGENFNKERMDQYQNTQKQNINGILLSLLGAGVSKFTANQSHPSGDAYFNFSMASWFSLGISAAFAYKFCTTPLPVQQMAQIEQKK